MGLVVTLMLVVLMVTVMIAYLGKIDHDCEVRRKKDCVIDPNL